MNIGYSQYHNINVQASKAVASKMKNGTVKFLYQLDIKQMSHIYKAQMMFHPKTNKQLEE